ncbi:aspartyl-tRNA synthetase [Hydrogenoanaerobacterium saccharovorans]|uniref:Aspartate--tRNA ligase n=1 Tax=Hydrogenoanaerobacterium saccharovorans TaxID=474960 RepID=A0A1H8CH34_9FIRM|nr:aspartate--tRNA ligase [Hydrogenoanaerobacterium saccharovorans]RPF43105.1 aspartyl-tRNA synthetase [Hydrogenoanaerobacterium saccharovorans]SEM94310.1 aspartyl-tRNA synthetase [Hydrogenoanaerobacterium saccharovorans]
MADTMNGLKRTNYCTELTIDNIGKEVVVAGWVQKIRNLGNLLFIDLRDRSGILQLAFDDATAREVFEKAETLRGEYVIMAKGVVRKREAINKDIKTGDIEIFVVDLRILGKAQTPPFEITDTTNVKEELRLKYRYLDLRRSEMQRAIQMRHKIVKVARDYYDEHNFLEIETPILIKSTPEGARDYLVPSRLHEGKFYALPQSPQLYKQLLMLSGFDRYLQIARCFRDEDLRADRQPEFTQIDLEMSFADEEDIMCTNEGFIKRVMKDALGVDIETPFRRISYAEAMNRYGSDKPDTRFGLELIDLSDILKNTEFKVFAGAIAGGGSVRAINVKDGAHHLSRKEIDKLTDFVKTYKAKGLAYTRLTEDSETSSFEKFLNEEEKNAIRERMGAKKGDVLLVVADADNNVVYDSLGALRCEMADRLGLIKEGTFDLLWVTDFPLFEYSEEENRYVAKHHPFTMPKVEDIDMVEKDPAHCLARAYDMVMNGCEVGGGSVRINDPELQERMFKALGFTMEDAREKFGFLIDAYKYGAPPHCGMAFGLDRLVMLMLEKDSIRDVIAFPKVQNASEPMSQCPNTVEDKSLRELHIKIDASAQPETK